MPNSNSSSTERMPAEWVQHIWTVLRANYGAHFDRQWQCPAGVEPAEHVASLMAVWGEKLGGFAKNPAAIRHALDNLPADPPNLLQFRALCIGRPEPAPLALPAPPADPARVAAAMATVVKLQAESPKDWAWRLKEREESGERLSMAQKAMWRAALGSVAAKEAA